jgi:hypothetical protein
MSVAADDVFIGGKLLKSHRTAGVKLLGGYTHFTAQAELAAVGKAGGSVDIYSCTVNCRSKRRCFSSSVLIIASLCPVE